MTVANFQALQHSADTALTLGCTCGDGIMQTYALVS